MWTKPVNDRTAQDVYLETARGICAPADLIRIGCNTQHLAGMAGLATSPKTSYADGQFLYASDLHKLLDDVGLVYSRWPALSPAATGEWYELALPGLPLNGWREFNRLETIQRRMLQIAQPVYEEYYCGDVYAGEY